MTANVVTGSLLKIDKLLLRSIGNFWWTIRMLQHNELCNFHPRLLASLFRDNRTESTWNGILYKSLLSFNWCTQINLIFTLWMKTWESNDELFSPSVHVSRYFVLTDAEARRLLHFLDWAKKELTTTVISFDYCANEIKTRPHRWEKK
jgi:hypothetical protein